MSAFKVRAGRPFTVGMRGLVVALLGALVGCVAEVDTSPATSWSADPDVRDEAAAAVAQACAELGECLPEAPRGAPHGVHFQRGTTRHAGAEAQWVAGERTVSIVPASTGPVLRQAILHELGHALGLPHDDSPYVAVMQPGIDAAHPEYAVTSYTCQDRREFSRVRGRELPDCDPR